MNLSYLKGGCVAAVVATTALLGSNAQAATYTGDFDATSVNTGGNDHTFWFVGLLGETSHDTANRYWQFDSDGGTFSSDGATASLTGTIVNNVLAGYDFLVNVAFSYRGTGDDGDNDGGVLDGDVDKKGSAHGGDPFTWDFYDMTSATLTGTGASSVGNWIELTQRGPVFQVGDGANDKSSGLGASGWFDWTLYNKRYVTAAGDGKCNEGYGDINVNLVPSPVPLPAAGLLLIGAVGALGAAARRKSKTA